MFTWFQNPEIVGCEVSIHEGSLERARRFVAPFVGQLKSPPVHRHAGAGTKIAMDLHGFGRVAVLIAHEPTRFIGTDRNHREVWLAEFFTDSGKQARVVTGVAGKIESVVAGFDEETAPKPAIPGLAEPITPMLGGCNRDCEIWLS